MNKDPPELNEIEERRYSRSEMNRKRPKNKFTIRIEATHGNMIEEGESPLGFEKKEEFVHS